MTAYERFASSAEGRRHLAAARLRHRALEVLHQALDQSKMSKTEIARKLGIRKSAVSQVFKGDGNVRLNTLADYLDAMDFELEVKLVPAGTARRKVLSQPPRLNLIWSAAEDMDPVVKSVQVRSVRRYQDASA